jgi:hypothetical protein
MQFGQLKRREFITLIGGVAVWPVTAPAQQGERKRHIGMLMAATENDMEWQNLVKVFIQRLQELGWTQDRNLKIDFRWVETGSDRLEALAKELVELKPELIISQATITTIVATDPHCPDHIPACCRSRRQQFRKKLRASRHKRDRILHLRSVDVREMARTAQGDRARHRARRSHI